MRSADSIWLWGSGKATRMPSFKEKYGLEGAAIAAVDLVMGIARCLKLRTIEVPGATGYLDTNYVGKVDYGLEALKGGAAFLYLHVEAPDETGHEGDLEKKLRAIEDFDRSKTVLQITFGTGGICCGLITFMPATPKFSSDLQKFSICSSRPGRLWLTESSTNDCGL